MLEEYMLSLGHNEDEISLIKSSYPLNTYTESTLLNKYKTLVNFFHRNGIDNESIRKITTTIPTTISMSIEDIKDKIKELSKYSLNKVNIFKMIKNYPYILEMSSIRINNKYQLFKKLHFSLEDINELLIQKAEILNKDPGAIEKRINQLVDYGYDRKDIPTIINSFPTLLEMSINTINKKQTELKELGFNKEEIIKITYYLPSIYEDSIEDIETRLKCMIDNGYVLKDIISIIKKLPTLLKISNIERIEENINHLKDLEFDQISIIDITMKNPYILLFSKDVINDNFKLLSKYSYYNAEIIRMIIKTPLLITYNTKELNKRLDFYKENKCLDIIKNNSNYLLYSLDIIEKRKEFVKDNLNDLFLTDKEFYTKYKVTRKKVLEGK